MWAEHAGSSGYDIGSAITADSAGNSYVTGYFWHTATFGSSSLTTTNDSQIFVAKLDNTGVWQWAQQPGGNSGGMGNGISRDQFGNLYVTGGFFGAPEFGTVTLTGSGSYYAFAAKLDASGNWLWGQKGGGTGEDIGWGIAVNSQGNSTAIGHFTYFSTFGSIAYNYFGFSDIYIGKLTASGVPVDDPACIPGTQGNLSAQPNPFSGTLRISVKTSPQDGNSGAGSSGTVSIYDLRGRLVKTFQTACTTSGRTELGWDGKDANGNPCFNGIYLIRFSEPGKEDLVKKVSLIK